MLLCASVGGGVKGEFELSQSTKSKVFIVIVCLHIWQIKVTLGLYEGNTGCHLFNHEYYHPMICENENNIMNYCNHEYMCIKVRGILS